MERIFQGKKKESLKFISENIIFSSVKMTKPQESLIKKIARSLVFNTINSVSCLLCRVSPIKAAVNPFPRNILVLEFAMLGDLLISTPFFASLRKTFPQAHITLACTPWSKDAVCDSGFFDEIFTYEAFWEDRSTGSRPAWKHAKSSLRLLRMLQSRSFNVCFAISSRRQPFIPFFAFLSKAKTRVGIGYGLGDRFLTHAVSVSDAPLIYAKKKLLTSIFPSAVTSETFCFNVTEKSRQDVKKYLLREFGNERPSYFCISPSTSQPEKLWTITGWITIANALNSKGSAVLISGGKSDLPYVSEIYDMVDQKAKCRNIAGLFNINQVAGLFQHSLGLITVESAPMHVAGLLDIPCVVLMSRIYDYKKFMPISKRIRILVKDVSCAKCEKGCPDPCCMDFTPKEVLEELDSLLASQK
jgi:heptosyltransferase-1